VAELGQPLAQPLLGQVLRDEQREHVRLARRPLTARPVGLVDRPLGQVVARDRVDAAGGDQPVEHAEVLEHLRGARLQALAARPDERVRRLVDQCEGHVPAGQVDGERQPGGTGATDDHVQVVVACHGSHLSVRLLDAGVDGVGRPDRNYVYDARSM
jgi:hypothetical protein